MHGEEQTMRHGGRKERRTKHRKRGAGAAYQAQPAEREPGEENAFLLSATQPRQVLDVPFMRISRHIGPTCGPPDVATPPASRRG